MNWGEETTLPWKIPNSLCVPWPQGGSAAGTPFPRGWAGVGGERKTRNNFIVGKSDTHDLSQVTQVAISAALANDRIGAGLGWRKGVAFGSHLHLSLKAVVLDHPGVILYPEAHLAMSRDTLGCHHWGLP